MKTMPPTPLKIAAVKTRPLENGGYLVSGPSVTVHLPFRPRRFYRHGWQSWDLTAWEEADQPPSRARPKLSRVMHSDPRHAHLPRHHGSWLCAVEEPQGDVVLVGALDLESHLELDGETIIGKYSSGSGDWFVIRGRGEVIFSQYASLLVDRFGKPRASRSPRIWCSWYSLYPEISEPRLLNILGDMGELPFEVILIDDGWERAIGDWEANEKFPSGMEQTARRIRATGRTAGLWLAPLLVAANSDLYQQHPDWLLRDEKGRLVSAGFQWRTQLYALDTSHPQALDWLTTLMKQVRAWGYDYVKLDFLYAGALPGKRRTDRSPEVAYRNGLQAIREALGDAYLVACGAPILPSLGLCDGLRVGPDVAEHWFSPRDGLYLREFSTPGVQNALRTSINRLWLAQLVHVDPDAVYFRSIDCALTEDQKALLQDLADITDFKTTSDPPSWLKPDERRALAQFLERKPNVKHTARYIFEIEARTVDFEPFIALTPRPKGFNALAGALLGCLADSRMVLRTFDRLYRHALRRKLKQLP